MNQALTNFTDAHNSLIQNKDDYMNNQHLGAGIWNLGVLIRKQKFNASWEGVTVEEGRG